MIYLDYASTTPLNPRVKEAMEPYLSEHFGNASSIHRFGQVCRKAIDEARNSVIDSLGAFSVHEIIFTGSGTESCNMAIIGAALARKEQGNHIVISALEHPAVKEPTYFLRDEFGFELTEVLPNEEGIVSVEAVEAAIKKSTILVSVMLANNEVGTIQPVQAIAELARKKGILFHTDVCQAPGYLSINVGDLKPDLMSLNGSKIYGPKGVGLLYVREGLNIVPLIRGGGQEFRMRGGTENTANIVGFAKALELVLVDAEKHAAEIQSKRDKLLHALLALPGITLNGSLEQRLPNNINIHTPGHSGESLVMRLDMEGLAASSGSACSSGKTEPSPTLLAMGQSPQQALESLRLSLGRPTTDQEIEKAIQILSNLLQ